MSQAPTNPEPVAVEAKEPVLHDTVPTNQTVQTPFYRSFKLNYKFDSRRHAERPYKARYRGLLPKKVDFRGGLPPVRDQGSLGCCVSEATANALQFSMMKVKTAGETSQACVQGKVFTPSVLFIYYNGRVIEGNAPTDDSGLYVHDGLQSVQKYGVCSENNWGFDVAKFSVKPNDACYRAGKTHKLETFAPVPQTLNDLKSVLAEGNPLIFGFTVYDSFMSQEVATTGIVPLPNTTTEQILGGHCVLCVGYDDDARRFLIMNSWSTSWALQGFCWMPYDMLKDSSICSDFWVVRSFKY